MAIKGRKIPLKKESEKSSQRDKETSVIPKTVFFKDK